jgi:hypothetical protein
MKSWNTGIVLSWLLQLVVAGILLQTLFFKFTGAAESVYIFSTLGVEPGGRIGSGVVELIASLLLLIPATATIGAALALGVMAGAIVSHVAILGIEIQGDGGLLFALAIIGWQRVRQQCNRPTPGDLAQQRSHLCPPQSLARSSTCSVTCGR